MTCEELNKSKKARQATAELIYLLNPVYIDRYELRRAVAESLGWEKHGKSFSIMEGNVLRKARSVKDLPNWEASLDLMSHLLFELTEEEQAIYKKKLTEINPNPLFANSRQQALAFVRTKQE